MKKMVGYFLVATIIFLLAVFVYFFVGSTKPAERITWGASFSQLQAESLGLDWKEVYIALLDDLKVERLKISVDWDRVAVKKDAFVFDDIDWQVTEAEKRGVDLLLVMGMRTPRWPECHIPAWAQGLARDEQQQEILSLLEKVVKRYKDSRSIAYWQVENEPLLPFGECPWRDRAFLEKEIELVKELDPDHPVVVSDSGEFSLWLRAGQMGDVVSTTMYRIVWFKEIKRYVTYPLSPIFYARKAKYINALFGKRVIVGELQAEPWGPGKLLANTSVEEQDRAFDINQFKKNIEFAKSTGFSEFYLWGAEWWYWRKEVANDSTFWNQAKELFK